MGRKYAEPETMAEALKRWLNTERDAFGKFTGTPNRKRMMPPSESFKGENRLMKRTTGEK